MTSRRRTSPRSVGRPGVIGGRVPPESPQSSDSDWLARSTASGVIVADRLDTQAIIDDWYFNDATGDHISLDTNLKPHESAGGSLKHAVLNSDAAASGQFSIPFGQTFGNGDTIWFSYRVYFQPDEGYAPWPPLTGGEASKLSILSRDANGVAPIGSNQINEFVFQLNYNAGRVSAYYRDHAAEGGSDFGPIQIGLSNTCSATEIVDTPDLDNGTVNPLTGTNPDTGSAWSACEQLRAQLYSLHYSARSSPGADNFARGLGDPFDGGFRAYPGEWVTITGCVVVGTFNTASSRLIGFAARDGEPYKLLFDRTGAALGAGPDYNGLNLLPYTTGRTSGGRQVSSRGGELSSAFEIWNVSPTFPTGDATLSYNATTGRFTLTANGDSAGTARGFSSANGFLDINIMSNTEAYFINGRVTPANLPGSGTTNETITIATNRPDTQRNYSDVIISTQPINAPGGYAPTAGTELSDLAASMSPGDWAELTTTDIAAAILNGSSTGNILPFSHTGVWDALHGEAHFMGQDHGGSIYHVKYTESTNAWTVVNSNLGLGAHGYDHLEVDPATGDLYLKAYNSAAIYKLPYGGVWDTAFENFPSSFNITFGMVWWSGSLTGVDGGGDALVIHEAAFGQILAYDIVSDDWPVNESVTAFSPGYHNVAAYSPDLNLMVFGGGNNENKTLYKFESDHTVTQFTDAPSGVDIGIQRGAVVYEPNSGNFLIATQGAIWEFNPAGTGTYTEITGSPPPAAVNTIDATSNAMIVIPVPTYGVMMFISADGGSSANVYLYKHDPV